VILARQALFFLYLGFIFPHFIRGGTHTFEKGLQYIHGFQRGRYPQFFSEDALAALELSQRLTALSLCRVNTHEFSMSFLVAAIFFENFTGPFSSILIAPGLQIVAG